MSWMKNQSQLPNRPIWEHIKLLTVNCNYEERREGQEQRSLKRGEGTRRVNTSGFLQRQQQQQCLSIFHWLRCSLEEANSSCGSHSGAPCVASLPPLMNSTTVVVGLWELPGLSLLRHYNMLNSPQRLPDWHQCIVWTVQWGPHASKKSTFRLTKEFVASTICTGNVGWCNETVKLQ